MSQLPIAASRAPFSIRARSKAARRGGSIAAVSVCYDRSANPPTTRTNRIGSVRAMGRSRIGRHCGCDLAQSIAPVRAANPEYGAAARATGTAAGLSTLANWASILEKYDGSGWHELRLLADSAARFGGALHAFGRR